MHRALAAWLTARPWRAAFASASAGALSAWFPFPFVIFACAIAVLVLLQFGLESGIAIAVTGVAAATFVVVADLNPSAWVLGVVLLGFLFGLFFGSVALAALLKRTGSMNLCVQIAVLAAAAIVLTVHAVLDDPGSFWLPLVQEAIEATADTGLYPESERGAIVQMSARTMWGVLAALSLAVVLGALFLGRWWQSLLSAPGAFGREYRRLRLGVVLGTSFTIVFALLLWNNSTLLASLAWVGLPALVFQGLAAAHRSKARGKLNRGWLAAIYVLLVVPLSNSVITICALAVWGFIDNWRKPNPQSA
ncbi:MAG: hypothetical protein GX535_16290 [Xanthomonadaceae bacterium]|nr:hypothetical protein [Xanthomonadaceae bacterium]